MNRSAPLRPLVFLALLAAAPGARAQSAWCADPGKNRYVDVHQHGGSAPLEVPTYEEFLAQVQTVHADAVANQYTANLIVNLPGAKWWSRSVPAEYKTNIVISGVIRPQARNEGEVINGIRYPDEEGDPLRHIDLFKRYGARAIKLLAAHNMDVGLGSLKQIRHCAKFDDWSVRPPHTQKVDEDGIFAEVDCAAYDDDTVPLGIDGGTFHDYLERAAALGMNVIVHGDDRFGNGERTHMGVAVLANAVGSVRQTYPGFKLIMLHDPQLAANMLPGGGAQIVAQPGLYWETSARKIQTYAEDYHEAIEAGDEEEAALAIESFERFLGDLYLETGIADRFVFGSDMHNPATFMWLSRQTYDLLFATFTAPGSPFASSDPAALFCEHGAMILNLP